MIKAIGSILGFSLDLEDLNSIVKSVHFTPCIFYAPTFLVRKYLPPLLLSCWTVRSAADKVVFLLCECSKVMPKWHLCVSDTPPLMNSGVDFRECRLKREPCAGSCASDCRPVMSVWLKHSSVTEPLTRVLIRVITACGSRCAAVQELLSTDIFISGQLELYLMCI